MMGLPRSKTAMVYGAAGPGGAAVAGALGREGARVVVTGRTRGKRAKVAEQIRDAGGKVETAVVDALDKSAVRTHADEVAATGGIDIAFNATSNDDLQGIPLLDMEFTDFARPVSKVIATHFNIATVSARHMLGRGGVILALGGGREAIPRLAGSHVASSALSGLSRQLATDPQHPHASPLAERQGSTRTRVACRCLPGPGTRPAGAP